MAALGALVGGILVGERAGLPGANAALVVRRRRCRCGVVRPIVAPRRDRRGRVRAARLRDDRSRARRAGAFAAAPRDRAPGTDDDPRRGHRGPGRPPVRSQRVDPSRHGLGGAPHPPRPRDRSRGRGVAGHRCGRPRGALRAARTPRQWGLRRSGALAARDRSPRRRPCAGAGAAGRTVRGRELDPRRDPARDPITRAYASAPSSPGSCSATREGFRRRSSTPTATRGCRTSSRCRGRTSRS